MMTCFPRAASLRPLLGALLLAGCGGASTSSSDSPPGVQRFGISGVVSSAATSGVTVTLTGASTATTTTDSSGTYAFSSLAAGSYVVAPSLAGFTFDPPSLQVTVTGEDVTGKNFVGAGSADQPHTHSISGIATAVDMNGVTFPVTISLAGPSTASVVTDSSGAYSFTGLADGTYGVIPSRAGFTFTPTGAQVVVHGEDVTGENFAGYSSSCP